MPGIQKSLWANPILLGTTIVGLVLLFVVLVLRLQDYSERQYRSVMLLDDIRLHAYDLMAAGWRAANANYFGESAPGMDRELAEQEARDSIDFLAATIDVYRRNFAGKGPAAVRETFADYVRLHDRELALLKAEQPQQAFFIALGALATFDELRISATTLQAKYESRAEESESIEAIGTVAVFALAVFGMGFAIWRFRKARARAERAESERELLRRSEARFRPLVQGSKDLISVIDEEYRFAYISPAVEPVFGVKPEDVPGKSILDFIPPHDRAEFKSFVDSVAARPRYSDAMELYTETLLGPKWIETTCTNQFDNPEVRGLVLNTRDVTERKQLEEQLRHQAFHDALTGLANAVLFRDRLEHALVRARSDPHEHVSVVYMDLDHFKAVNDDLGHHAGDELLAEVARRIEQHLRPTDTAARLGGDEFAVLVEHAGVRHLARDMAGRLLKAINAPIIVAGRRVELTASIGVVDLDDSMDSEEVLRNADLAMYDAKENGRGRIQVYKPDMHLSILERMRLSSDLNGAVERGEILVYYQPTVDLRDQRITGFEALARWDHPQKGLLPPEEFIPLAEDTGVIQSLGRLILKESCRQARQWQGQFETMSDITISVNVSAKQVTHPGLVELVREALDESGLDPRYLVLEVTESILLPGPEPVFATLHQIKALGVRIALDDFGTGYSSLSYLKRFPIDMLKIDRSFIEELEQGDREKLLVQTVIDLGHTLNLQVVAEGIERKEQLLQLQNLNCISGQGYLFSRPVDSAMAARLLENQAAGNEASKLTAA